MRALGLLSVLLLLTSACSTTIGIHGGPGRKSVELSAASFPQGMRPLIADSPRALAAYQEVEADNSTGTVLLYAGLGSLVPCIALPTAQGPDGVGTMTYAGLGFCAATIALEVAALFFLPGPGTWGDVLRAHNEEHPEAPYYSEALGVEAAER